MAKRPPKDLEKAQEAYRRGRAEVEAADRKDAEDPIHAAAEAKIDKVLGHLSEEDRKNPNLRAATKVALFLGEPPPESVEEVEREQRRFDIVIAERNYANRGNPMDVFRAYLLARNLGDPLPDWVLDYLDRSISDFWSTSEAFVRGEKEFVPVPRENNDPAEALATAFGVKRGKGERTIWDELFVDLRRSEFFGEVVIELAEKKSKEGTRFNMAGLLEEARAAFSKSRSAAWKAWNKYEDDFPQKVAVLKKLPGFRSIRRL